MTADKVPMWTPEDETNLVARVRRSEQLLEELDRHVITEAEALRLVRRPKPPTAITMSLDLAINRLPKPRRCPACRLRRVLYRIVVTGGDAVGGSEPRCVPCWGIR